MNQIVNKAILTFLLAQFIFIPDILSQEKLAKHTISLDIGYTIKNQLNLELGYILKSKYYFSLGVGTSILDYPEGTEFITPPVDPDMYIIWALLEIEEIGINYQRANIGFGRFFGKHILIKTNLGVLKETNYVNTLLILNGEKYYIINETKFKPDAIIGFRYFPVKFLSIGLDSCSTTL